MNWYLEVLKKYAQFGGRARRQEYWMFVLINILVSVVLAVVDRVAGFSTDRGVGLLGGIYTLFVIIPSLAVLVRRLHDTGRSGWWWWILFVPCVGWIILLVFLVGDSDPQPNQYGPNPKLTVT